MTFKIEKNVPAPPPRGRGNGSKYPFADMVVGDSFFAPDTDISRLSSNISVFRAKFPDTKFTCRTVEGGTRVWRIA